MNPHCFFHRNEVAPETAKILNPTKKVVLPDLAEPPMMILKIHDLAILILMKSFLIYKIDYLTNNL